MAKYDYGGGCACGLQRECDCYHSLSQFEKDWERIRELEKELKDLKRRVANGR